MRRTCCLSLSVPVYEAFAWTCVLMNAGAHAEVAQTRFRYHEGFEGEEPVSVSVLASNAKYTVNYQGITDEKHFSGKRSYKVDFTFQAGTYCFLFVPLEIPAAGELRFSGRILVGEETTGRAGLGVCFRSSPPILRQSNGSRHFPWFQKSPEWREVKADIAGAGRTIAHEELTRWAWGLKPEQMAIYAQGLALYLVTRPGPSKGGRIVVYVDDLKVDGEVPKRSEYQAGAARSWAEAKGAFDARIAFWDQALSAAEKCLNSFEGLPSDALALRDEIKQRIDALRRDVDDAGRTGFITKTRFERIEPFLDQIDSILSNIGYLAEK